MSDTSINKIIQYGTAAARAAYTPDPPSGIKTLYIWYETDNAPDTYIWDGSAWVQINNSGSGGNFVQSVITQTGTVATGTTIVPLDNTKPQNGEGVEYMTRAITPTDAANELWIDVTFMCAYSVAAWVIVSLFQDSNADALATMTAYQQTGGGGINVKFTFKMAAGTTSSTTFKVRAGGQTAGTLTFNGTGGAQLFGGVMASSIRVTETIP